MTLPALLFANKPAALFGVIALMATLGAGVQSLRLAHAQAETADARLAFAQFKTRQTEAVLAQQQRDAQLSAELVIQQADRLARLHDQTLTSLRRLADAPVTRDCGPVMRDASRSLRALFGGGAGANQPPAGSQPAAALPRPGADRQP
jgi:multidrug resistance efflux pump